MNLSFLWNVIEKDRQVAFPWSHFPFHVYEFHFCLWWAEQGWQQVAHFKNQCNRGNLLPCTFLGNWGGKKNKYSNRKRILSRGLLMNLDIACTLLIIAIFFKLQKHFLASWHSVKWVVWTSPGMINLNHPFIHSANANMCLPNAGCYSRHGVCNVECFLAALLSETLYSRMIAMELPWCELKLSLSLTGTGALSVITTDHGCLGEGKLALLSTQC